MARVSSDLHRQQHGQGTNTGRSQDILLDGGRETAKEGSEKPMSVKWDHSLSNRPILTSAIAAQNARKDKHVVGLNNSNN